MSYIPLNVKTSYYLLSSLNDIKQLINKCKQYNINTIAVTDPNMFSVMEFYKECKKNDIKPIIGLEINLDNNLIYLYAMNYEGYQNLTRLLFFMQEDTLNLSILKKYNSNLLCIIPYFSFTCYQDLVNVYEHIYFSYSNLDERKELSKNYNNLIFMNNVLYLNKEDDLYLRYLYLIRDGKSEDNINDYNINLNCLMTNEEVKEISNEEDLKRMNEINNLCNISFSFNEKLLPKYNMGKDFDEKMYLVSLCKKGLEKRLNSKISENYINRLKHELSIISSMGFNNYFLVVWDFIKYAKKNNILVGPGRGSAAGSLVSYCLGITDVDPIKYNLFFERFLNPERISMPDIDIDFESTRREEVVSYVIKKYGKKRAMPIITFVTLGGRQVIRDVGRILKLDVNILDKICKIIDPKISLMENSNNFKIKNILNENKLIKKMYEIAGKLEGMKRQFSVHAAGMVISNMELDSYIPLHKYNDYYITGISMEHLEELGLLKIDFLGLRNLTLINNVINDIKKFENINLDFNKIPLNDLKTLSIFGKGLTEGVFQFESIGMKNFIGKLKPSSFEEIVAAIALFRPGPMSNINSYINRKFKKEVIEYIHNDLKEILDSTYGIIIYQEQIMQIANIMADYTLGEADVLRRAMSKKKKDVLENEKYKFINRSINKGYAKEIAEKVYNLILKFADYGFNRAHSVAYALIGYRMAYLKVHYPKYFMSNLLTNVIGSDSSTKNYIEECKANDISILKPDINRSEYNYKVEELGIRFSLAAIRNVGSITCHEIIKERVKGEFIDFFDFVGRTYGKAVNKKALQSLIDASCFSIFGYNHKTLYHNLEAAINYAELIKELNSSLIDKPVMEVVKDYDKDELLKKEKQAFGFYLSSHPVSKYKGQIKNEVSINMLSNYFDKIVTIIIYVDKIKIITTKKNKDMAFILGSDEYGVINIVLFPDIYSKYSDLKIGDIVYIKGKVEKRMSSYQLIAMQVEKMV